MSQTSDWLSKWANRDPMYPMLGSKWYTHTNRYWFQLPNCKARLNPSALDREQIGVDWITNNKCKTRGWTLTSALQRAGMRSVQ